MSEKKKTWSDLFPLPWSRLLPSCSWIKAANGEHALDVRGWGYMTGTGGGLAMSGHEAIDIQAALADEVVMRVNSHAKLVEALKAAKSLLTMADENHEHIHPQSWMPIYSETVDRISEALASAEIKP